MRGIPGAAALMVLLMAPLMVPGAAAGQTGPLSPLSLTVGGGLFDFDLSGTGQAPMGFVRLETDLTSSVRLGGSVVVARPEQQFGETTTFVSPELQIAWSPVRVWRIAPYLGAGVGFARAFRDRLDDETDPVWSAALGARVRLAASGGLAAEGRLRAVEWDVTGSAGELTLGWFQRL